MRNLSKTCFLALALLQSAANPSFAQPLYESGITNLGDKLCPLWTGHVDRAPTDPSYQPMLDVFNGWAMGYLKGAANQYSAVTGSKNPLLSLRLDDKPSAWMQAYCRVNPRQSISNAAENYLEFLKARQ